MKLLKIGSSSSNNIVLHSDFVSSYHAEMILLDNGDIILEDKNSKNGTFVGNQKLTPFSEVSVKRGDYIRFADVELQWSHVPLPEKTDKYKSVFNIGTNFRNDIVINGEYVSRFHANLKIAKNGKAYITDVGSKNGTKINGMLIQPGKATLVKRGDVVICGDTDISEQINEYLPARNIWLKRGAIASGIAVVIIGLIYFLVGMRLTSEPKDYRPAVVYVDAQYTPVIIFEDCPIHSDIWCGVLKEYGYNDPHSGEFPLQPQNYSATAFFIDREGRMATNRHVAKPWEYSDEEMKKNLGTDVDEFINSQIPQELPYDERANVIVKAYNTPSHFIWKMILLQAQKTNSTTIDGINSLIRQIRKCKTTISGKNAYIRVGYPGRNYSDDNHYDACTVKKASESRDADIAILQLDSKKTPDDIKKIFDVDKFYTKQLDPLKDRLYWIGYPRGNAWALDNKTKSLEPEIRETMCSKMPSKYDFEFQGEALGGASGSPIFNSKGELVGVLWGGWVAGATFGHACQAKFLKKLYKEELEDE